MTIEVFRGGATRKWIWKTGRESDLRPNAVKQAVEINFNITASRGETNLLVRIDAASFHELAKAMMAAKPREAIKAFGAALQTVGPVSVRKKR